MSVLVSSEIFDVSHLVGLLLSLGGGTLDGLGDVVGGVLGRIDDLADDALVRSSSVGCRHFCCVVGVWGWFGLKSDY